MTPSPSEVMDERDEMPDNYFYPYLLLACMWTWASWGSNTPSEWKHLASSSGPKKRKKSSDKDGEINIAEDNFIGNPSAMSPLNPNGNAMNRRHKAVAEGLPMGLSSAILISPSLPELFLRFFGPLKEARCFHSDGVLLPHDAHAHMHASRR